MRRWVLGVALTVIGSVAGAAPPEDLVDFQTFEKELKAALVAAEKAAAEAARDPERELIAAYREEEEHDHARVVELIRDADDARGRELREEAVKAIGVRFDARRTPSDEKAHLDHKKDVSEYLVELLSGRYSKRTNEIGIGLLRRLWGSLGPPYETDGNRRKKNDWIKAWKRFLKRQ